MVAAARRYHHQAIAVIISSSSGDKAVITIGHYASATLAWHKHLTRDIRGGGWREFLVARYNEAVKHAHLKYSRARNSEKWRQLGVNEENRVS